MKASKNQKENDPLVSLKYKGYCRSNTAPGEELTLEDLTNYAKFILCKHSKRLMKDPIWDEYTDEEILVEYYAHLYSNNEEMRKEFEAQINAGSQVYGEDIYEWLEAQDKKLKEEHEKKLRELPEKISFSPSTNEDLEE